MKKSSIILSILYIFYFFLKTYKTLCYSKITLDWLPMINQYTWPFSIFRILTKPYFYFWSKYLPFLKFQKFSIDISNIFALEILNYLLYFIIQLNTIVYYYI
jgi:uncharacterized protein YggT (Ycf19 family)